MNIWSKSFKFISQYVCSLPILLESHDLLVEYFWSLTNISLLFHYVCSHVSQTLNMSILDMYICIYFKYNFYTKALLHRSLISVISKFSLLLQDVVLSFGSYPSGLNISPMSARTLWGLRCKRVGTRSFDLYPANWM